MLAPLKEKVGQLRPGVAGRRRELAFYLLLDTLSTSNAVELLVKAAPIIGKPHLADQIEPLVRHAVERAIVIAYVGAARTPEVVDRYLKTSAVLYRVSFGQKDDPLGGDALLKVPQLPPYAQMAAEACPELGRIYKRMSWISHPRSALPYSMHMMGAADPITFSALRTGKALGWLDEAIKVVLHAYETVDAEDPAGGRMHQDEDGIKTDGLPLALSPSWRGAYDERGTWISTWPPGLCKECGQSFDGTLTQRWCSPRCRSRARNRSGSHAARTRRAALKIGRRCPPYEIIGRFELHDAFRGLCGKCGTVLPLQDTWIGHVIGVEKGGQHTRGNIAAIHKNCEQEWNREQREAEERDPLRNRRGGPPSPSSDIS